MEILTVRSRVASLLQKCAILVAMLVLIVGQPTLAANQSNLAAAVKAAFILKFGDFVAWPEESFSGDGAPFTICVLGTDPFQSILDQVVAGQVIGSHKVTIRRLQTLSTYDGCHILFVAHGTPQNVSTVFVTLKNQPVLIITDEAEGLDADGMIHFVIRDGRVRFNIDEDAADRHGLKISSKLLGVALAVHRREQP